MDDRKIIELYNQRDEDAIKETDAKYGKYCFTVANNILFNHQDSEECVNDTYIQAWNCIPPQQPNSLKLFLARITRNLSFNRYKEQKREKRGGGEMALALEEIDEVVADTRDISDEIAKDELVDTINRFLHSLPQTNANIVLQRYFYCHSTKDIADMYGLTEGNVRKILLRTRKKLRQYLQTEGYAV